jgi:acetoacetyl-CoA synthetase
VGIVWQPTAEYIASTNMESFRRAVQPERAPEDVRRWAIEEPGEFWRAVWNYCGIVGDAGEVAFDPGDGTMIGARFFPGSHICVAENMLEHRPGAAPEAVISLGEDGRRSVLTWSMLRDNVAALARALRADGVSPGDRVAAWMPNVSETLVVMLAANAVGATFTSTSSDFGVDAVVERFAQTTPVVLVAATGYRYAGKRFDCLARLAAITQSLPSVRRTILVSDPEVGQSDAATIRGRVEWAHYLEPHRGAPLEFLRMPGDHPAYILYSSGTTGPPKCIVHRALGVLLMHVKEQQLHCDVRAGDRVFYFTTCGWMMWNWLISALASGATIVLYDGSPTYPGPDAMFRLGAFERVTLLGVSAKLIDTAMKAGVRPIDDVDLRTVRTICSTGSPLSATGFEWIYDAVSPDVHLASISGGTDLCGCLVCGDPTRPVYAGEIQGPALGMAVDILDEHGTHLDSGSGELVCTRPFPSMPLGLWNDETGRLLASTYFERFPGVWTHGDFGHWTPSGGIVIEGRSDATLNAGGVRIGTAELYAQLQEIPEVMDAVVIGQVHDGDTRIVLFVRLAGGVVLSADLEAVIRHRIRTNLSPRHVPARIAQVADVPRTRSGKLAELAVADAVHGRPVRNVDALANPDVLEQFRDRHELLT